MLFDPLYDVDQERRRVALVLHVFILSEAHYIDKLAFRENLLGNARLWEEHRESIGHITLFHEVSDQTDRNFKCEPILSFF